MIITDWVLLVGVVLAAAAPISMRVLDPRIHRLSLFVLAAYLGLILVIVGGIGRIFFMFFPL